MQISILVSLRRPAILAGPLRIERSLFLIQSQMPYQLGEGPTLNFGSSPRTRTETFDLNRITLLPIELERNNSKPLPQTPVPVTPSLRNLRLFTSHRTIQSPAVNPVAILLKPPTGIAVIILCCHVPVIPLFVKPSAHNEKPPTGWPRESTHETVPRPYIKPPCANVGCAVG